MNALPKHTSMLEKLLEEENELQAKFQELVERSNAMENELQMRHHELKKQIEIRSSRIVNKTDTWHEIRVKLLCCGYLRQHIKDGHGIDDLSSVLAIYVASVLFDFSPIYNKKYTNIEYAKPNVIICNFRSTPNNLNRITFKHQGSTVMFTPFLSQLFGLSKYVIDDENTADIKNSKNSNNESDKNYDRPRAKLVSFANSYNYRCDGDGDDDKNKMNDSKTEIETTTMIHKMTISLQHNDCNFSYLKNGGYEFQCGLIAFGHSEAFDREDGELNQAQQYKKLSTIINTFKEKVKFDVDNCTLDTIFNKNLQLGICRTHYLTYLFNTRKNNYLCHGGCWGRLSAKMLTGSSGQHFDTKSVNKKYFFKQNDSIQVCVEYHAKSKQFELYFVKNGEKMYGYEKFRYLSFDKRDYLFALSSVRCDCVHSSKDDGSNPKGFVFHVTIE